MNIYFSGIGGVAIGPLSEIALDVGYTIQGSDQAASLMTEQLEQRGVAIAVGPQDGSFLEARHAVQPIDWLVYTSSLPSDHPELLLARELGIKTAKRDELIAHIIAEKNLKMIAVAGTHGKTTTTGMIVWLAKYFSIPISYSVGTTLSWGPSGRYVPGSEYFVYECDEFDRNFLAFSPFVSLITSLEHDHPDTYPTEQSYIDAFTQFCRQSNSVVTWREYAPILGADEHITYLDTPNAHLRLPGEHNRRNASLILAALKTFGLPEKFALDGLNKFPGTSRRFEKLASNLYTDYGHTPTEIAATLQMAHEIADSIVLIYQPHQNVRQHKVKDEYTPAIFQNAEEIYWLPTYQSREDPALPLLTPEELTTLLPTTQIATMSDDLWQTITAARDAGKLVLLMGAGDIDAWARKQLEKHA